MSLGAGPMAPALRVACALALLASAPLPLTAAHRRAPVVAPSASVAIGEAVYRFGRLPSGQLMKGRREGGVFANGAHAPCVNWHRPRGLGAPERARFIPPLTPPLLFLVTPIKPPVR